MPQLKECLDFIEKNKSFFITPIIAQDTFYEFYKECNGLDDIRDYSDKLQKLLYHHVKKVGENTYQPVINFWRKKDFAPALEHASIREFILKNQNHPALNLWRKNEGTILLKEKRTQFLKNSKFNTYLQQIWDKGIELRENNCDSAADAAFALHTELKKQEKQFINLKITNQRFTDRCSNAITAASKGELSQHRNIFTSIFNALLILLNYLTRGFISTIETKSIKIIKTPIFLSTSMPEENTEEAEEKEENAEEAIGTPPKNT